MQCIIVHTTHVFSIKRSSLAAASEDMKPSGRPPDQEKLNKFDQLCEWLEEQTALYIVAELHDKMFSMPNESHDEVYGVNQFKTLLEKHFNNNIFFISEPGRSNVVCFKDMASSILSDQWYIERKTDVVEEPKRISTAAANIIRNEVRCTQYKTDCYPSISDMISGTECLPSSQ